MINTLIYLRKEPTFRVAESVKASDLTLVAIVGVYGTDAINPVEASFEICQNTDTLWHLHEQVKLTLEGQEIVRQHGGLRSLSVGDFVQLGTSLYQVATFGWAVTEDDQNGGWRMEKP